MISIKPRDYNKAYCDHAQFRVDRENDTVECGKCGRVLEAMHVLQLLACSEQRRRWWTENREEHARKLAAKTIKAAVIILRKRAITPERFAVLYEKYKDEEIKF